MACAVTREVLSDRTEAAGQPAVFCTYLFCIYSSSRETKRKRARANATRCIPASRGKPVRREL